MGKIVRQAWKQAESVGRGVGESLLAPRYWTWMACLAVVVLAAGRLAAPAQADDSTPVYVFKLKNGAGNPVYKSGYISGEVAGSPAGFSPSAEADGAGLTPAVGGPFGGSVCWDMSVTGLSGWFPTPLYTMHLDKCWSA